MPRGLNYTDHEKRYAKRVAEKLIESGENRFEAWREGWSEVLKRRWKEK